MKVGILGCGYVSEYYAGSIKGYEELELVGAFDLNAERQREFCRQYGCGGFSSYAEMLADDSVDLVVNLTDPASHFETSRRALLSGKHVYTEKPMALRVEEAEQLIVLAQHRGLAFVSAPSTLLGSAAQTLFAALRSGLIGAPKLVYAEMDDGAVHQKNYRNWKGALQLPWPWKSEFETGCVLEHAAYHLTWLTAFFGAVRKVTAISRCVYPDKHTDVPITDMAPDLSIAFLDFETGVVCRLTCGVVAPTNHMLTVVGEEGVIDLREAWNVDSPLYLRRRTAPVNKWPDQNLNPAEELKLVRAPLQCGYEASHQIDFAAGLADMRSATRTGRSPYQSNLHALHALEVSLALQEAGAGAVITFDRELPPMSPLEWATPPVLLTAAAG